MKLAWLTDIHLNFLDANERKQSVSRNDLIEIRSFWRYFDSTGSVESREAHC
jgi:hypothetical protein